MNAKNTFLATSSPKADIDWSRCEILDQEWTCHITQPCANSGSRRRMANLSYLLNSQLTRSLAYLTTYQGTSFAVPVCLQCFHSSAQLFIGSRIEHKLLGAVCHPFLQQVKKYGQEVGMRLWEAGHQGVGRGGSILWLRSPCARGQPIL